MKLVAVFNRDGGTFRTTDMQAYCDHARQVFTQTGHEVDCRPVDGKDIMAELERAADEPGIDGIIAGGGDGTISAAAGIAWKHGIALGVIPAGTMNLFARSLKVPLDIHQALDTLATSEVAEVDIASANGRLFVHQFSAGLHSRMVRYRNNLAFASRLGKIKASVRAAINVILNPPVFEVEFTVNGEKQLRKVSAISVSNNEFGQNALLVADDVSGGHLGFYLTDPLRPAGVAKLALDILRGRFKENASVTAMTATAVELHFPKRRHDVRCVIDGELLPMERDVALKLHARELKVLVGRQFFAAS
ncbi:diacylglycerol kinase family protein [Agrobacterium tumefaciens]|uniref:diacylglycerol/lipid kinase family protein n=1 Tax=Agrobacterium tumefaciens TaxID=358 RepID=UPI00287D71DD|nr:diacylglycerol kinase family protein [Agrobacterium tumefaciens]MDS7596585.1 diacylglycerol kinase family protein [Agrobacterium tumefaciens]